MMSIKQLFSSVVVSVCSVGIKCSMLLYVWILFISVKSRVSAHDCFMLTIDKLRTADCHNKSYTKIPKNFEQNLQKLQFQNNLVTFLDNDEFVAYRSLQEIYLQFNRIDHILPYAFRELHNLQVLDLEGNRLSHIPRDSFQHLSSVRILNLKGNQIKRIDRNALDLLYGIEALNFENNFIEYIHPEAFSRLSEIEEINLVNNELESISAEMQDNIQGIRIFRIHHNPWKCDCHLRWLREKLEVLIPHDNWQFSTDTPVCSSPELIEGVNWKYLDPPQFACAARIESNSSTTIQVVLGSNITIDCEVFGDPEPQITWQNGSYILPVDGRIEKRTLSDVGIKHIKSTLSIAYIKPQDLKDYKCIAQNNAGISQVSYKLWAEGVKEPGNSNTFIFGFSREIEFGVLIGAGVLILLLFICCIACLCKKQDKRNPPYNVRKNSNEKVGNHSPTTNHTKPITKTYEKCDRGELQADRKELLPDKSKQTINTIDRSRGMSPENTRSHTIPNDADNRFQMKIFSTYEQPRDERNAIEPTPHCSRTDPTHNTASRDVQLHKSTPTTKDTPDLLNESGSIVSVRVIPVPPPVIPYYVSSSHPRAAENPYVTPSELRTQPMRRKTASADDLLDSAAKAEDAEMGVELPRTSRSRDDLEYAAARAPPLTENTSVRVGLKAYAADRAAQEEYATRSKNSDNMSGRASLNEYPGYATVIRKPVDTKPRDHSSTCTNPVCLQDPNLGLDSTDYSRPPVPRKPSLKQGPTREIDVDTIGSPEHHGTRGTYSDMSKTLPNRAHKPADTFHHSPPPHAKAHDPTYSKINPATKRTAAKGRNGHQKTVSFSEQGHPIIDLTNEMPEPIVLSSQRSPRQYPSQTVPRQGYSSPLPQSFRGPVNISGVVPSKNITQTVPPAGHNAPLPNGSPVRQQFRSQNSTTLDDLLSPPFGHVPTSVRGRTGGNTMFLPSKRDNPKPGEKDEFGTAV